MFNDLLSDTGPAVALRGDRIRCTVLFEKEQEKDGKVQVPVLFTLNGRKMMIRDGKDPEIYMDSDKPLYPFVTMNDGSSVVAKVRTRDAGWGMRAGSSWVTQVLYQVGSEGGAVVRALACHQCGLGSIPGPVSYVR